MVIDVDVRLVVLKWTTDFLNIYPLMSYALLSKASDISSIILCYKMQLFGFFSTSCCSLLSKCVILHCRATMEHVTPVKDHHNNNIK